MRLSSVAPLFDGYKLGSALSVNKHDFLALDHPINEFLEHLLRLFYCVLLFLHTVGIGMGVVLLDPNCQVHTALPAPLFEDYTS